MKTINLDSKEYDELLEVFLPSPTEKEILNIWKIKREIKPCIFFNNYLL